MNKLKIVVLCLALVFLLISFLVDIPKMVNDIIYGSMAVLSILFVFTNRKELHIDSMFDKKKDKEKSNNQ